MDKKWIRTGAVAACIVLLLIVLVVSGSSDKNSEDYHDGSVAMPFGAATEEIPDSGMDESEIPYEEDQEDENGENTKEAEKSESAEQNLEILNATVSEESLNEKEKDTQYTDSTANGPNAEKKESEKDRQNSQNQTVTSTKALRFRNKKLLQQHYEKHGIEMGFKSAADYESAAAAVVENPDALHKTEQEDNDDIYYIESTNEIVFVSEDGYIRTYFNPSRGIRYYNEQ